MKAAYLNLPERMRARMLTMRGDAAAILRANVPATAFVIWALPLLIATALIVPPWTISDEPFHMLRAVQVAQGGMMGKRFSPQAAGGISDPSVYVAFKPVELVAFYLSWRVTRDELRHSDAVKWHRPSDAVFVNSAQYPPFFYLPDALGYWLGRAMRLHVNTTLIVARLCNALAFTTISALAIAMARRNRPLVMALLMLPMCLVLGASASQDALLLPTVALVVAAADRIVSANRFATPREMAALAVIIACIGMARPPYATLILLLFMVGSCRHAWRAALCVGVAVLLWCGLVAAWVMVPVGESNPAGQWQALAAHPAFVGTILWRTLLLAPTYASEFVGRLAWNDTPLPTPYLVVQGCVLAAACGAAVGRTRRPGLAVLAVAGAIGGILVLQYFDWTEVGTDHVEGVVGRYFIPLAMVLGLGLPGFSYRAGLRRGLAYAAIGSAAVVTPAVMLHHLYFRFYVM